MITVLGATGHTGREITRLLLDAGEPVLALGRSERRLAELGQAGAQTLAGEANDAAYLTEAFRGADAVYTLLPFDPRSPGYLAAQAHMSEAIVQAIRDSGVRHVVTLSSVGADRPTGTGFVTSLHAHEQRLRTLDGVNVLVLRPGAFFESFEPALALIQHERINGDTVAPDVRIAMIASRDVAAVAAAALRTRDFEGVVVRELLGPRDLTYAEVTSIIGRQLGIPGLPYVQFPEADMVAALAQMGLAEDFAALHIEFNRALTDGTLASREPRSPANSTPTRFEDFAAQLVAAHTTD